MSANWVTKQARRVPTLLKNAAAGDLGAVAILVAMGLGALYYALKDK